MITTQVKIQYGMRHNSNFPLLIVLTIICLHADCNNIDEKGNLFEIISHLVLFFFVKNELQDETFQILILTISLLRVIRTKTESKIHILNTK